MSLLLLLGHVGEVDERVVVVRTLVQVGDLRRERRGEGGEMEVGEKKMEIENRFELEGLWRGESRNDLDSHRS